MKQVLIAFLIEFEATYPLKLNYILTAYSFIDVEKKQHKKKKSSKVKTKKLN